MQIKKTLLTIALAVSVVLQANSQKPAEKLWLPATYHDLTVGVSTKDDVFKALGKPKAMGKEQDTGLPTMTYLVADPEPGVLTVYVQKGVLDGMTLSLKKRLSKSEIIRLFGSGYVAVQYDTDDCLGEGGAAPIYESANGPIKHLEYRDKGIGVIFHEGEAVAIAYVSKPFGPSHSICAARTKKKSAGSAGSHK
jgi:hypothetical protein